MRLKLRLPTLLAALVFQLSCAAPPPPDEVPIEVAYAGCSYVQPGRLCFLEADARIRLWARSNAEARLEVSGPVEILETREVQAGKLFVLRPQRETGRAVLKVVWEKKRNGFSVSKLFGDSSSIEIFSRDGFSLDWRPLSAGGTLQDVERLYNEGQVESARANLEEKWPKLGTDELGRAWRIRGRLERAAGESEAAFASLHRAVAELRRGDWLRQSVSATAELAYGLIYDADRFAEARALLEGQTLHPEAPAEARYGLAYLRGLLALNTGDVRGSLQHLGESVEIADRLGLDAWRMSAEQPLAHQLQRVGRGAEAAAIFSRHRRELPPDLGPCDRASLLNNLAWNQLLIRESGDDLDGDAEDPTPWLLEAREAFRDRPCVETDERANVELNLALAALHRGEPEQARHHLDQATDLEARPNLRSRFWQIEIEARIAMASGRATAALERYDQLKKLAEEALATKTWWRAEAGKARALEAMGQPKAALDAYREAERLLDAATLAVPIDSGREGFVDRGLRVTRHHLDLLIRLEDTDQAFRLARRARSRVLRSLHRQSRLSRLAGDEQRQWDAAISTYRAERRAFDVLGRDDWTLSVQQLQRRLHDRQQERGRLQQALDAAFVILDALSPALDETLPGLARGEARLLYFPGVRGWIGFAERDGRLVAARLDEISPTAGADILGAALLGPFMPVIEGATVVRLLPFAWLRDVDFHALPVDDQSPLLESSPVVYGLDLPSTAAPGERVGDALIVADPNEDLDAARTEGNRVAEQLRTGWTTRRLDGSEATSSALRQWLPQVDLFHYAGHGLFVDRDGWQSALPLAGDSLLTLADILTLERAPSQVVLSACETARSDPGAEVESVTGLAHAFLTAGSHGVLAAVRPVDDRMASELVRRYYAAWLAGADPPEALRRAQLAMREVDPDGDWSSFRLLEP